ncbi:hypothetical protein KEJ23_03065 [Candidatus Bathyarchaeota archaeon]|nr:hypothetical protein [Candidatus Bathyarchaeota archaeon]
MVRHRRLPLLSLIFLGRKAFAAISEVVKLAGGHYSAGKASRFIIPKELVSG